MLKMIMITPLAAARVKKTFVGAEEGVLLGVLECFLGCADDCGSVLGITLRSSRQRCLLDASKVEGGVFWSSLFL